MVPLFRRTLFCSLTCVGSKAAVVPVEYAPNLVTPKPISMVGTLPFMDAVALDVLLALSTVLAVSEASAETSISLKIMFLYVASEPSLALAKMVMLYSSSTNGFSLDDLSTVTKILPLESRLKRLALGPSMV